jgi:plastocyanin
VPFQTFVRTAGNSPLLTKDSEFLQKASQQLAIKFALMRPFLFFVFALLAVNGWSQGTTGTIKGHVHLTGKLPGNPYIRMGVDPMCSQANAGKRVIQEYVVAAIDGSLGNVFVRLQGHVPQSPVPAKPVMLDQHGCIYTPRVIGVRVGQTLQIKNSDSFQHNVHGYSGSGNSFNENQSHAGVVYDFKPTKEEVMLHIQCDIHKWMNAYVGIVTNPYFAVSNTAGNFEIGNVPPGTYTLQAWQEKFGFVSKTITVKAGAVTNVDFAYTGNEKPSSSSMRTLTLPAD